MDSLRKVTDFTKNSENMGAMLALFVSFVMVIYVVLYLFKQFNMTSLKTLTLLKEKPLRITGNSMHNLSQSESIPSQAHGKEFSMSFWVYVDNEEMESTSEPKFVIGRTSGPTATASANPLVYMDSAENKMHVVVRTNYSLGYTTLASLHAGAVNKMTVDYIPLQRWVNVIVVVDQNYVQLFVDGELRQVEDLSQGSNKVVMDSSGDIYSGGNTNIATFKGYLSKVQWFNYAVTIDHAKIVYAAGPLRKTVLSLLGLPMYGVRSPFVRIDESTVVDDGDCQNSE
jgi:hypothetical protein